MRIHIIGLNEPNLCQLAVTLSQSGYEISGSDTTFSPSNSAMLEKANILPEQVGWFPERMIEPLNAVLLSGHILADNPELRQAQEMALTIYSIPEFLHLLTQHKTRVLITGCAETQFLSGLLRHVLAYWEKEVDFYVNDTQTGFNTLHLTKINDFIIIDSGVLRSTNTHWHLADLRIYPNITLLCGDFEQEEQPSTPDGEAQHLLQEFLKTVVPGGSITYNADNPSLSQTLLSLEAPVRKFPYHRPKSSWSGTTKLIETPEGWMPLSVSEDYQLQHIEGVRWICQQIGVDATDFYEALASF